MIPFLKPKIVTDSDYNLDYQFVAELYNGQIVKQTPDDKPRFSAWGTMMTDLSQEKVKRFSLVGKGHTYTVDLTDGHFEIDGRKIYPPKEILPGAQFKLIYYRTIKRDMNIQAHTGKGGLIERIAKPNPTPKIKYVLGWEYNNIGGKNHKWEMAVE